MWMWSVLSNSLWPQGIGSSSVHGLARRSEWVAIFQGIFLTQGSKPHLLPRRRILLPLRHWGRGLKSFHRHKPEWSLLPTPVTSWSHLIPFPLALGGSEASPWKLGVGGSGEVTLYLKILALAITCAWMLLPCKMHLDVKVMPGDEGIQIWN